MAGYSRVWLSSARWHGPFPARFSWKGECCRVQGLDFAGIGAVTDCQGFIPLGWHVSKQVWLECWARPLQPLERSKTAGLSLQWGSIHHKTKMKKYRRISGLVAGLESGSCWGSHRPPGICPSG